jgi:hypothetical protein
MNLESIKNLMELSMMDSAADIKAGKEIDMQFYFFFSDGYCKIPDMHLEKHVTYGIINLLLTHFKPKAYASISDCFVRDINGNLSHEQLLAIIVDSNGESSSVANPYDRTADGDIVFRETDRESICMKGIAVSLFNDSPIIIADSSKKLILDQFETILKEVKVQYEQTPFKEKSHTKQHDKGHGGMTLH